MVKADQSSADEEQELPQKPVAARSTGRMTKQQILMKREEDARQFESEQEMPHEESQLAASKSPQS